MRPIVILDIETVPSGIPYVSKPGQETRTPPPPHHAIYCAAALVLNGADMTVSWYRDSEPRLLLFGHSIGEAAILDKLRNIDASGVQWVTFAGRSFDWPVIVTACIRLGVQWPRLFSKDLSGRYGGGDHTDLMDVICWYGSGSWSSVDALAKSIGFPGKGKIDGSKVSEYVATGRGAEVEIYNLHDVVQEAAIAMAQAYVGGLFGGLGAQDHALAGYRLAAQSLLDLIDFDPRLVELRDQIDRDVFLRRVAHEGDK
jgi:hypothetical protein